MQLRMTNPTTQSLGSIGVELRSEIEQIATIIDDSSYVVGMTGAGMSVESGIPPFRGADGLWTKYGNPPMDGYSQFKKDPDGWWNRRTAFRLSP